MNSYKINRHKDMEFLTYLIFFMPHDLQMHSFRVAQYSEVLSQKAIELGYYKKTEDMLSEKSLPQIGRAVLYHDIGKLMTPMSILEKSDALDESEWQIIRQHPIDGVTFLENLEDRDIHGHTKNDFYTFARDAILGHHERWDGNGYPYGVKGEDIPVIARICAIADAYDAITAYRAYQPALPHKQACDIIENASGKQYDPDLIEVFKHCKNAFETSLNEFSYLGNIYDRRNEPGVFQSVINIKWKDRACSSE